MGYEELIKELIRNAEAKAGGILTQGREKAEQVIAKALEETKRMEREFHESLTRDVDDERRIRMNRARMEARAVLLQARASFIGDVFTQLEDQLRSLPQEKHYPYLVEKLYGEVLPELPEGPLIARGDKEALSVLTSLLRDRPVRCESLPEEELGGLEIEDESGTVRLRNTLKARLIKARPRLMVEINRMISTP